ncbi:MAG: hypothetical protein ICV83_09670 [Cytophagales bacterium]|nr:hypothetical protein [Cytophagales bacterium]
MKRLFWIGLTSLLAGCTATEQTGEQATTKAADSAAVAGRPAVRDDYDQLRGVWLNTKFEQALEKTKSPRRAAVDVPNVSFFREEGQPVAFVNLDFREGITVPLDSLKRVGNELRHGEVTLLLSPDGRELTLQLADQARMKGKASFRRQSRADLSSLEAEHDTLMHYINRAVLAGTYADARGETHVFTTDMAYYRGPATGEEEREKMRYELDMNVPVNKCDGVYGSAGVRGAPRQYTAFAWRGKTLELYRTEPDPDNPDGLVREKKPFAKLTRTGPAPKDLNATQ